MQVDNGNENRGPLARLQICSLADVVSEGILKELGFIVSLLFTIFFFLSATECRL